MVDHLRGKATTSSTRGRAGAGEGRQGSGRTSWDSTGERTAEAPPGPAAQPDKRESNGRTPTAAPGSFGIHEAVPERQHPPAPHKMRLLPVRAARRAHSAFFPFPRVFYYLTPGTRLCPLRKHGKQEINIYQLFSLQKLLSLFFLDSSFFSSEI